MATSLAFVWLGSGRTRKFDRMAAEGKWLDAAMRRGLPLPNGGILLDHFFQLALEAELVVEDNGRYASPNPQWLHDALYQDVHFPQLDKLAALSSLSAPHNTNLSVNLSDPQALTDALCAHWSTMDAPRDLLIMEMVGDGLRGTAVTLPNIPQDQIVPHGMEPIAAPKRGRWRANDAGLPDYAKRVQRLLDGVRRSLGNKAWKIKWADDGRDCWLLNIAQ